MATALSALVVLFCSPADLPLIDASGDWLGMQFVYADEKDKTTKTKGIEFLRNLVKEQTLERRKREIRG